MLHKFGMNDKLDLNLALNGGAADAGLTYTASTGSAAFITVDAATGVVTPIAPGLAVVFVTDASGNMVSEEEITILTAAQAAFEATGLATLVEASSLQVGANVGGAFADNISNVAGSQASDRLDLSWNSSYAGSTTYRVALLDVNGNPITLNNGLTYIDVSDSGTSHFLSVYPLNPYFLANGNVSFSVTDTLAASGTTTSSSSVTYATPVAPSTATSTNGYLALTTTSSNVNVSWTNLPIGELSGTNSILITDAANGVSVVVPASGGFPNSGSYDFPDLPAGNYNFVVQPYNNTSPRAASTTVSASAVVGVTNQVGDVTNLLTFGSLDASVAGKLTVNWGSQLTDPRYYKVSVFSSSGVETVLSDSVYSSGASHTATLDVFGGGTWSLVRITDVTAGTSSLSFTEPLNPSWGASFTVTPVYQPTDKALLGAVSQSYVSPTQVSATVAIQPVANATDYSYSVDGGAPVDIGNSLSFTINGIAGQSVQVVIHSSSAAGAGPDSDPHTVVFTDNSTINIGHFHTVYDSTLSNPGSATFSFATSTPQTDYGAKIHNTSTNADIAIFNASGFAASQNFFPNTSVPYGASPVYQAVFSAPLGSTTNVAAKQVPTGSIGVTATDLILNWAGLFTGEVLPNGSAPTNLKVYRSDGGNGTPAEILHSLTGSDGIAIPLSSFTVGQEMYLEVKVTNADGTVEGAPQLTMYFHH